MKPDLIILHGALGCKDQFTDWTNYFSEWFTCYTFDFSGHGTQSKKEVSFSLQLFSEDLKRFISEKGLLRPQIFGYSMGGYVALYTAINNPGLLSKIMTLATKFDWNPESAIKEAGFLKPELILQKVPQLAEQLKQRHGAHWEHVLKRTADMMLSLGANPLLTQGSVTKIQNKVKLCVGEKDKMVSVDETRAMHEVIAGSELCILPATGHLPETMDLKLIVKEVRTFLLTQ